MAFIRNAWARRGRRAHMGTGRRRARPPTRRPTLPRRPPLVHRGAPTSGSCQACAIVDLGVIQGFQCAETPARTPSGADLRQLPGAAAHGAAGVLPGARAACPKAGVKLTAGKLGCAESGQLLGVLLPSWLQGLLGDV